MAILTAQVISHSEITPTFAAADVLGDSVSNDGRTYLHFKNADAAPHTATVNSRSNCSQGFDHDVVVTIPATTGDVKVGPFPKGRFDDSNGRITWTYDDVTSVTVGAFRLTETG